MRNRQKSGGVRQRVWDRLREDSWPTIEALADEIGARAESVRPYIAALRNRGYISDGAVALVKDTGPRAPSWSAADHGFKDWNLQPGLAAYVLARIIAESGLSLRQWLMQNGFSEGGSTRLRQMMNGQRPVSSEIERAALNPAD